MRANILLAGFDNIQKLQIKNILSSRGLQLIDEVEDGYSALRILRSAEVDLTISDANLAGLNGEQLARIMAEDQLGPVIIASSSEVITFEPIASIYGYLQKPFNPTQLLNTVELALAQSKRQKELTQEVEKLKDQLKTRKVVDKAKGILMKNYGLSEDQAYKKLQKSAMEKRLTIKKVAEVIITASDLLK